MADEGPRQPLAQMYSISPANINVASGRPTKRCYRCRSADHV